MIKPLPLSIIIITKNEEVRLPRTLAAIQGLANEIIIIDSGSTDNTRKIAEQYGAKIIINTPFPGYGQQKRFAEDHCQNDWILNIDADEVMTPKLYQEIIELFSKQTAMKNFYTIRIIDMLPNEHSPAWHAYGKRPIRLYKRSCGRYNPSSIHDRVDIMNQKRTYKINAPLLHYSIQSLVHLSDKFSDYSDLQAIAYSSKVYQISPIRLLLEFPFAFLKCYLGRRYIFRGINGYLVAMIYANFRLMRLIKINTLQTIYALNADKSTQKKCQSERPTLYKESTS